MSTHANLGYGHLEQNQSGKEVTANAMANRIADALTDDFSQAVTGDFALAVADFQANWRFRLTGTPAADFTMTVPARKRPFLVDNRTGRHATVTAGSVATTVPPGVKALLYGDGTDILLQADNQVSVGGFLPGLPAAGAVLFRYVATRPFTLPVGLPNSQGWAGNPATAQADLAIKKNGVAIGTARFTAAASIATFILASDASLAMGDRLEVTCPSPDDATLADISITLAGYGT
jgi:hypothetical protein